MRVALAAIAFLALSLAGCVSTSQPLQPAALLPSVQGFLPAVAMDQPTRGAEPNIAVQPDGTLFITAVASSQERPNALQGAAWLWRSKDGQHWDTLRAPVRDTPLGQGTLPGLRAPFGSSDADVVASADGWVYYSDWWSWGTPSTLTPRYGSYLVERSHDGGASWDPAPVTTLDAVNGVDRQWLLPGNDGLVGLFYAYFHQTQNMVRGLGDPFGRADSIMSIQAVFSTDHGATWGNPVTVVDPVPGQSYEIGHPRLLPNGVLWMPYGDFQQGTDGWRNPSKVMVQLSFDNGTSWVPRAVADVPQGFDNLWAIQGANDDAGHVYVAWAARTGATMTTWFARSDDLGLTWSAPKALRAEGLNFLPWVAAHGDGHVAVAWYGSNATGDPTKAANDTAWFAWVAESRDGGATWSVGKLSADPVKVGAFCPKGAACTSDRELLDYLSVAYDGQGTLHAAFATSRMVDGAKAGLVHYAGQVPRAG